MTWSPHDGRGVAGATARIAALLALMLAGAALLASSAEAGQAIPEEAQATGALKLKLGAKAAKQMRKRGLKLRGKRGARSRGKTLSLPVSGGEVTKVAGVHFRGVIQVVSKPRKSKRGKRTRKRGKKRTVTLRKLAATVIAGDGHLVATIRGRQVTLLTFSRVGDQPFNPLTGEIDLRRARVALTPSATAAISDALRGAKLPRRLGSASLNGKVPVAPVESTNAVVRARPAGALDLLDASMSWRARESFVNYIHSAAGGDGGAFAVAPALAGPAELIPPSTTARVYEFELPFSGGWYDPSSGAVNAELAGGIRFAKPDYGIDLDAIDPVIELGGESPRVIAHLRGRASTSDQDGRTAVAVDLDQAAVTPVAEPVAGGTRYTYEDVPAINPTGPTAWVLAGYYQPGDAWGEVSVSYTVP